MNTLPSQFSSEDKKALKDVPTVALDGMEGLTPDQETTATERERSDERLRLLESVVVHANDTVIITDAISIDEPGPLILYVNEAFTKMTGYPYNDAVGRSPRFLQGPDTPREPLDKLRVALEAGRTETVEVLNYRKDGSTFWAEMSVVPVVNREEKLTHWISIQRDVTERRNNQQLLKQAKDEADEARNQAEQANLAKSEFLSRMSHELRTPLNAILGFGQLLETSDLVSADQESVAQILQGGRHLLNLINEVLDIARIESGHYSLSIEPVDVAEAFGEAVALIKSMAAQRNIVIKNDTREGEWHVLADKQRLKQVLLNLLGNGVKYNAMGRSLTVWCEPIGDHSLRLNVRDEGQGISLDKQERLFMPFDRLGIDGDGTEGTGIGLALSKRIVEAMDGQIGFESEVGQGSTFWLELPVTTSLLLPIFSAEPPLTSADRKFFGVDSSNGTDVDGLVPLRESSLDTESPSHQRSLILYIEDNSPNVLLVARLLKNRPVEFMSAPDGLSGLNMARKNHPALILLDLNLPDIDGAEVLRLLQQDASTRDIPVVMLSADATPRQIHRLMEAGAKAYLTKPFVLSDFDDTLAYWLNVNSAASKEFES